jgi:hypothetical protein
MHDRLWLHGLGWIRVSRVGSLLDRSLVDSSVGAPERLVFEGAPILEPPIRQDRTLRRAVAFEGAVIDTRSVFPELTPEERARVKGIIADRRASIEPYAASVRAASIEKEIGTEHERTGVSLDILRAKWREAQNHRLPPEYVLEFSDPVIGRVRVADILENPGRFAGEPLADPLEGPEEGPQCAKLLIGNKDGLPFVKSFAHGGAVYQLVVNAAHVEDWVGRQPFQKRDATAIGRSADKFIGLLLRSDATVVQREQRLAVQLDLARAIALRFAPCWISSRDTFSIRRILSFAPTAFAGLIRKCRADGRVPGRGVTEA